MATVAPFSMQGNEKEANLAGCRAAPTPFPGPRAPPFGGRGHCGPELLRLRRDGGECGPGERRRDGKEFGFGPEGGWDFDQVRIEGIEVFLQFPVERVPMQVTCFVRRSRLTSSGNFSRLWGEGARRVRSKGGDSHVPASAGGTHTGLSTWYSD